MTNLLWVLVVHQQLLELIPKIPVWGRVEMVEEMHHFVVKHVSKVWRVQTDHNVAEGTV